MMIKTLSLKFVVLLVVTKQHYLLVILYRMYSRYAEVQGWKTEVIEASSTGVGGYKEIIFMINGKGAYSEIEI